jgi:hypothetical protein
MQKKRLGLSPKAFGNLIARAAGRGAGAKCAYREPLLPPRLTRSVDPRLVLSPVDFEPPLLGLAPPE